MSEEFDVYDKYILHCKNDQVNHPSHYQCDGFEVIDIIEKFELGFNLGNVIKYILRSDKKDDTIQDLEKAIWYLKREIEKLRSKKVN